MGDIAGSRFEHRNTPWRDFAMFDGTCRFTDDTVCTVGVADAILHGRSYMESVHDWCRRYPHQGYGSNFKKWMRSDHPRPYGSFGNGAAMRVSPVAWAFDTAEDVAREAAATAVISHDHPEGIKGAVATALAIFHLRHGDTGAAEADVHKFYGEDLTPLLPPRRFFDVTCQGCVPLCWTLLRQSNDFEDALRETIFYGGDTDTTGAIVGSMAEALYGVPADFEDSAMEYLPDDMLAIVEEFKEKYGRR